MVGCGGMAGHHALGYAELTSKAPGLAVIDAVCDADAARAQAVAARLGEFQPMPTANTEAARNL
jgi:predicted dehydrogenase